MPMSMQQIGTLLEREAERILVIAHRIMQPGNQRLETSELRIIRNVLADTWLYDACLELAMAFREGDAGLVENGALEISSMAQQLLAPRTD